MGCAITDLVVKQEISLKDLSGKILAVDAMNQLYMFLSSIRGPDGALLTDSKGQVTSHLSGLFFRFAKLMQENIRFVFVFDGKVPELKWKEQARRKEAKLKAEVAYEKAAEAEDVVGMKKFAARTSKLTKEMRDEAVRLIRALGCPVITAPSEGEAQAAYLVKKGQAFAVMSQDADCLLFGGARVVKNLSITGRKKQALAYRDVSPELISLQETLQSLAITQDQLIVLGMLVGTDYNIGGIKRIGPKNALKLVHKHGNDLSALFAEVKWDEHFAYPWEEVFRLFKGVETTDEYELSWKPMQEKEIVKILVEDHEFGEERVLAALDRLNKKRKPVSQKGLGDFF
ncbi:MAG: flap endonuclease-1 [Nanoarchaeota archaeon]